MATTIQIGDLDRRVKIRRWQDVPGFGSDIDQTLDAGLDVWGKIEPVGNAIFFGAMQVGDGVTHRVMVLWSPSVNDRTVSAEHVVEEDGLRYRVKRSNNFGGLKIYLYLEVELLGQISEMGGQA